MDYFLIYFLLSLTSFTEKLKLKKTFESSLVLFRDESVWVQITKTNQISSEHIRPSFSDETFIINQLVLAVETFRRILADECSLSLVISVCFRVNLLACIRRVIKALVVNIQSNFLEFPRIHFTVLIFKEEYLTWL